MWSLGYAAIPFKHEDERKGVLLLDSTTYPKIVPHATKDIVLLVVLKSQIGDYGTDSLRADYFSFSSTMQTSDGADNLLFAQIIVNGAENRMLADRLSNGAELLHPKLYVIPAGSSKPVPYPADAPYYLNTLTPFVTKHTSLVYQLPGTMKSFDALAIQFAEGDEGVKASTLATAQSELADLTTADEKEMAAYYIKVMKKISENGALYLKTEIKRLNQLFHDDKLTKANRRGIEHHANVLNIFAAAVQGHHDEF